MDRDDTESHIRASLEVAWSRSNGNWEDMILSLRNKFNQISESTTNYMNLVTFFFTFLP